MRVLRLLAVLAMVLGTGVVPASASPAGRGARPAAHRPVGFFDSLGQLFVSFLTKEGCRIDPLGHCITSSVTTEEGCRIDPWGRCLGSTPTTDTGCRIDPLGGGCLPGQ
jgi:hypothetical protein